MFLSFFCLFGSTAFSRNRKPFVVPFESSNNLVLVVASVNGSKPLSFILDTGAGGPVINELAKELGLKLQGQSETTTGDGAAEASFVKGVEINR